MEKSSHDNHEGGAGANSDGGNLPAEIVNLVGSSEEQGSTCPLGGLGHARSRTSSSSSEGARSGGNARGMHMEGRLPGQRTSSFQTAAPSHPERKCFGAHRSVAADTVQNHTDEALEGSVSIVLSDEGRHGVDHQHMNERCQMSAECISTELSLADPEDTFAAEESESHQSPSSVGVLAGNVAELRRALATELSARLGGFDVLGLFGRSGS